MNNEKWYMSTGEMADAVISTRIRLARNIAGVPFPSRMNADQRKQLNETVRKAVFSDNELKSTLRYVEMDTLNAVTVMSMVERHVISPEFAKNSAGRGLIISDDESVSIMLCEEDHIRIQVMRAGLALDEAYALADKIDDILDSKLTYAFDQRLGYLTECPTNLGTGLRASVMLHLPALESCGMIGRLQSTVSKIGLTVRGTYGEGSKAKAAMYQLSNQVTLGISEQAAVSNLKSIAQQAMSQERNARAAMNSDWLEDSAYRALGVLKYARSLSTDEFMELISKVRLGISTGHIKEIGLESVGPLIIDCGAATLQEHAREELDAASRDRLRAKLVRERL